MALINGIPGNIGTSGPDEIIASAEDSGSVIRGLEGGDFMSAESDNITLEGGPGFDTLDGTFGTNTTASYANAASGVTVDLSLGFAANDGDGSFDFLFGIQNVTGSAFTDTLTGDAGANVLAGGAGNDTLTGGAGNDVFKYSFDQTQGGGGETFSFTEFFAANGGSVVGGEVADGTKQGQFSSLYTQWLESLGLTVVDLGQNSGPDGMPVVEGPGGTFGERESFSWSSGNGKKTVTHERWYSDTWTPDSGGGQDSVSSADGHDTILDFTSGVDKLDFSGINQQDFSDFFNVASGADTVITIDGFAGWSVTLVGVSDFALTDAVFSA